MASDKYLSVKREIERAIAEIEKNDPALAEFLREHIYCDDERETFRYDRRIRWIMEVKKGRI